MKRQELEKKTDDPFYSLLADNQSIESMLKNIPIKDLEKYIQNLSDDQVDQLPDMSSSDEDDKNSAAFWN